MKKLLFFRNVRNFLFVALALLQGVGTGWGGIIFVNEEALEGGDGTSWATAHRFLQDALAASVEGDDVWVAEGAYYPDKGTAAIPGDRTASFTIKDRVALYGGFAGHEANVVERDWAAHPTVLSGGIGEDSRSGSIHVVTALGDAIVDGVTITKGNANGDSVPFNQGGGLYATLAAGKALRIANTIFTSNIAEDTGGAIYFSEGTLSVTNCIFTGNSASTSGGAISLHLGVLTAINSTFSVNSTEGNGGAILSSGSSPITSINCTFSENSARFGGAILTYSSSPMVATNSTFRANSADASGGAIYSYSPFTALNSAFSENFAGASGGAIRSSNSTITTTNCTFADNSASLGGAILTAGSLITPRNVVTVTNCNFSGNSAVGDGGAILSTASQSYPQDLSPSSPITAMNCTFIKNSAGGSGGAIISTGSITVSNSIFSENLASRGGAISQAGTSDSSSATLTNCTLWNNRATDATGRGHAIYTGNLLQLFNNLIWDQSVETNLIQITQTGTIRNGDSLFASPLNLAKNLIRGGFAAVTLEPGATVSVGDTSITVLSEDPLFVDPENSAGPDGIWGTADDGLRIQAGSPAIGQGNAAFLPLDTFDLNDNGITEEPLPIDLAGVLRIQGGTLDLGAYETGPLLALKVSSALGGFTEPTGLTHHAAGSEVTLTANVYPGYLFTGWSGDVETTDNPCIFIISRSKTVTANFAPDEADDDGDGLTNYEEIVIYGTGPNNSDTSGDGILDGEAVEAGLDPIRDYSGALMMVINDPERFGIEIGDLEAARQEGIAAVRANPGAFDLYNEESILDLNLACIIHRNLGPV